jgi:tetratricopeptide (TPR) repeat protein
MEEELTALERADPLGARAPVPTRSWVERLQAALGLMPWPAWAGATVAVGLAFVAGLLLRSIFTGPERLPPGLEALRLAKPVFTPPTEVPALGIAPAVKPEAETRFREAMAFYDAADFPDRAIPMLKEAVAIDPSHDRAQFWLGIAYLLKGETTAAIPPLEEAARLAPGNREYKHYLVWAYLTAGKAEEALRLQTEILQKHQDGS